MSDTICWACGKEIDKDAETCPYCSMPLTKEETEIDLDDFLSGKDVVNDEVDDLLGIEEESEVMPSIPEFSDEFEGVMSDFDADMPSTPDMDEEEIMPSIPDFGDEFEDVMSEFTDEDETAEVVKAESPRKIWFKIFAPQWLYWSIILLIISFTEIRTLHPHIYPGELYFTSQIPDLDLVPHNFIFSWIIWIPMGFHFGYKLRTKGIEAKWKYMLYYLIGYFFSLLFIVLVMMYVLNPQFLTGTLNPQSYILTIYLLFTVYNFFISILTLGGVLFAISYRPFWKNIYNFTPMSKVLELN